MPSNVKIFPTVASFLNAGRVYGGFFVAKLTVEQGENLLAARFPEMQGFFSTNPWFGALVAMGPLAGFASNYNADFGRGFVVWGFARVVAFGLKKFGIQPQPFASALIS